MKFYHTTAIDNKDSIVKFGINAMITDKITFSNEQISAEGVFVFSDKKLAYDFGVDNYCEFIIFEMNINDKMIIDPEYDDGAWFLDRSIKANEITISKIVEY